MCGLPARAPPARRLRLSADRIGGCTGGPSVGRANPAARRRPSSSRSGATGAWSSREDIEDGGNVTRFVWIAPRPATEAGGLTPEELAHFLRARRGPPWRAGRGLPGALRPRDQPEPNRVRPLRRGLGRCMFFLDLEGAAPTRPSQRGSRRCESKAETVRSSALTRSPAGAPLAARFLSTAQTPRYRLRAWVESRASRGGRVVVLNATFEPIHVSSIQHTTGSCCSKAKAEMIERGEDRDPLRGCSRLERPVVIRLVTYVQIKRDVHITRSPARPSSPAMPGPGSTAERAQSGLTVDHVIPRSRERRVGLGEHRRLVRALQSQQGRPPSPRDPDGRRPPTPARPERLHRRGGPEDPGGLAAVLTGRPLRRIACSSPRGGGCGLERCLGPCGTNWMALRARYSTPRCRTDEALSSPHPPPITWNETSYEFRVKLGAQLRRATVYRKLRHGTKRWWSSCSP